MIPDPMQYLAQAQLQERYKAAEMHRLLKQIAQENSYQATTAWRVRRWLGAQLVTLGCRLQGKVQLATHNS